MSRTCDPCRRILSNRLRTIIRVHELSRRGLHVSSTRSVPGQLSRESPETTHSIYNDTLPPTRTQASAASQFFLTYQPRISWVAEEWRKQVQSSNHASSTLSFMTPEIAFLGRSNTGKSSLLNALLHAPDLCRVGAKPGKTTTMHAWTLSAATHTELSKRRSRIGSDSKSKTSTKTKAGTISYESYPDDRLTVLDMPGYGHGSREEWGTAIVKYLQRRRQLRRTMVLVNPKHGVKEGDEQIIQMLQSNNIPYQIIACKCDTIPPTELSKQLAILRQEIMRIEGYSNDAGPFPDNTFASRGTRINGLRIDDILAIGGVGDGKMNKTKNSHGIYGLDDVRWTILKAVGLDGLAMQEHNNPTGKRSSGLHSKPSSTPAYGLEERSGETTRLAQRPIPTVQ